MSDYNRIKAVRYKLSDEELAHFAVSNGYELRDKFEKLLGHQIGCNPEDRFELAMTESDRFLDYVLVDEEGEGEYGKVRELTAIEKFRYGAILDNQFYKMEKEAGIKVHIFPIQKNFRLVDFCWYNCCEAPDYFDEEADEFYDEV